MTPERLTACRDFVLSMPWPGDLRRDSAREATAEAFTLARIGQVAIAYVRVKTDNPQACGEVYSQLLDLIREYEEQST